ncbi:MAG: hypothetical protein KBC17_02900 [Candidatus Pacebacteria bacterium]|nr:hypothetical protein [Candidatus Paceibacterota bacterium]
MNSIICPWEPATYYIFSSNVPQLFYYSHGLAVLFAVVLAILIFRKNKTSLQGQLLILIISMFSLWVFFDLLQWATNRPEIVLFFWSITILIEAVIFLSSVYLVDVFITGKDISYGKKIGMSLILLPVILLLSTKFNLAGMDASSCNAIEGPIATYYIYAVEIISLIWIFIFSIRSYFRSNDLNQRKQIGIFTVGIVVFLMFFIAGNIYSSISDNWIPAQYGLFGMPIFICLLAYMIVKFKTFNVKLLGAQLLVTANALMVGTQFFFIRTPINRVLNLITLTLIVSFGYFLIKNVKREIEQRERLEQLRLKLEQANLNLEVANDKLKDLDKLKTEFLSLAAHQLRSPLTAIKGYTSMLIEGDFGKIGTKQKDAVNRVFESSVHLSKVVEDLLNVSKIEAGGMKYQMAPFDMEKAAGDLSRDLSITAEKKGLKLIFETDKKSPYTVNGDMEKIRQVILNVIDNAIKYTEKGSITVMLSKDAGVLKVAVTDTGMGISAEEKEKLFQKFSRGAGGKMNTGGSGLGLYLAKTISEAHGGRITIDSPGVGLGSTFTIELKSA